MSNSKLNHKANDALVAIMNNKNDLQIAANEHWYRIPTKSAPNIVKEKTLKTLAFYQTKVFGNQAFAIRHYAEVLDIQTVQRKSLFPHLENDPKAENYYHKIILSPLQCLPNAIQSLRYRRIVFIPTTKQKLFSAHEINHLFNDSPLEDVLQTQLNACNISVERNYFLKQFNLDFAIFCQNRNINIECDGNTYHLAKPVVLADKYKTNHLQKDGWTVLRFTYNDIINQTNATTQLILQTINQCGGILRPTDL